MDRTVLTVAAHCTDWEPHFGHSQWEREPVRSASKAPLAVVFVYVSPSGYVMRLAGIGR